MMKKVLAVFSIAVLFSFYGCEIDSPENFQFVTLKTIAVDLPEAFEHNAQHNIQVTYERPDDCTFFEGFDVFEGDLNTRNIVAIGSLLEKEECVAMDDNVTAAFLFTPINSGNYTLRFYSGDDEDGNPMYLEYVVPVRPEGVN